MPSIINTNISSLTAQRNLGMNQASLATSMQRLSSGLRINSAKDDAAGLAISERMTAQIRGNNQAARNANDGISLAQTAEGDLAQISNNLQRMRELAVQASNATNSSSDRAALDNEVQALSAEVDRVAQNSSFNGVKLLDGSFSAQTFQVGANGTANDRISINSIASTRTSQLGGVGASFQATVTGGRALASLVAGDLTLNGFQVGDSGIGAAPGQSTASAFSIAAAINNIQSSSGVTAVSNANTVTGGVIGSFGAGAGSGAIAANTLVINGINTGAIQGGATAAGQGANVAAAINAIATQTGVTAAADATDGHLTLTATDGRDIKVSLNLANGATPIASAQKTAFLAQTGLATANVGINGTTTALSGAYTPGVSANATDLFKVTVDGISVFSGAADATANSAANLDTAFANFATTNTGYRVAGSIATNNLTITKLDGSAVVTSGQYTNAAGTGVPAGASLSTPGGGLFGGAGPAITGAAVATTTAASTGDVSNHGTITLSSNSASGIVWAGASATKAGFAASGSQGPTNTSSVNSIASINVLTADNATKALAAIDGALTTVNASRASLGAIQNRFTSVVTSLQTTSENLTASRSRIQDADFALETANLSRAQILQQAGTAMVAQANQLPQSVLSLLK